MAVDTELERRLRSGLRGAAETIPAAAPEPSTAMARGPRLRELTPGRRRRLPKLVPGIFAAAATVAVVAAAVVVLDGDDRGNDLEIVPSHEPETTTETTETTETTTEPAEVAHVPGPANGMVPGQAVIEGSLIHFYGPDGSETGSLDTGLLDLQDGASDLQGGWVVCGYPMTWFKADGTRRPLEMDMEAGFGFCASNTLAVVDSAQGRMVIHWSGFSGTPFGATVLETGETTPLQLPLTPDVAYGWAASTGRILLASEEAGLQLFDITAGQPQPLPLPTIELGGAPVDVALSPDGASAAVLTGQRMGPLELTIYDLASGEVRFQEEFAMSVEGAGLSYDGATVAVGNWYDRYGPIQVIDVAAGGRYEIDIHGGLL